MIQASPVHAMSSSAVTTGPTALTPLTSSPTGGRLVAVAGQLPLRSVGLAVDAVCGAARVKLEQVFDNPHAQPLRVRYELPLPADAAVSGFAFRIGDRRIVGTVDEVKKARETFERAIAEGRTAALLEETRTSLFAQELGNIPPGATVVAEILIDQPLIWVDVEGSWEWRFPLTAAPRYLGAVGGAEPTPGSRAGRTPDASRMMLDVTEDETGVRASLSLQIRDALVSGRSPESPSHPLQIDASNAALRVALGGGGSASLDRDLVVRWPVALASASLSFEAARTGGVGSVEEEICAVLTVVPPVPSAARDARCVPRDLAILLDTSGSMDGEPLAQAKRIASALVASLTDRDGLDLVEFSSAPRRFQRESTRADAATRTAALAWIKGLRASGGTEMLEGITASLAGLRPEAQRQVVVVTDGLIGFEQEVVAAIQKGLPRGSRVHAVGVGSATNRTLLAGVARVGGGVEVVVGLGEDPERAAQRVLARTAEPVVVDLALEGGAVLERAPAQLPDLYAGAPARIALRVRPEGGEVIVRGRAGDGAWHARVTIPPRAELTGSDAPAKLFARERASDLEAELSAGRDKTAVDRDLVVVGLRYSIATRMTSWVAATEEATVDPTDPTRRQTVPQALPFGSSAEGMGLRASMPPRLDMGLSLPQPAPYVVHPPPSFSRAMASGGAPRSMGTGGPAGFAPPPAPPPAMPGRAKGASTGAPPPPRAPSVVRSAPAPQPAPEQKSKPARADDAFADEGPADEGRIGSPGEAPDLDLGASLGEREEASASEGRRSAKREEPARGGLLGGIARRVRELFTGPEEPAPEALGEPAAPEEAAAGEARATGGPAVQQCKGRVVLASALELVVEIDVAGEPLDLRDLEIDVLLVTTAGVHVSAKLRAEVSTRPGVHGTGTTVRLVLMLANSESSFAQAYLRSSRAGTPPIRVELSR